MENIIITTEVHPDHRINYEREGDFRYSGNVYTGYAYDIDGIKTWEYCSKTTSDKTYSDLNDDCRCIFEFSFVWRGAWEGRIYFLDDEYWSEEIKEMATIWDKIETYFKDKIISNNPEYLSFD